MGGAGDEWEYCSIHQVMTEKRVPSGKYWADFWTRNPPGEPTETLWDVSLDEALEWSGTRSARIQVWLGNERFSAGSVQLAGQDGPLPKWDERRQ